jgi:hypothetical protein
MFVFVLPKEPPPEIVNRLVEEASLILFSDKPPTEGWSVLKDCVGIERPVPHGINMIAEILKAHLLRV